LKITKWGHFRDSKWSLAENLDFTRTLDFWAKNVSGPSKSLDFVPGPFRILDMTPFSDF
jgi:hypothetical protein